MHQSRRHRLRRTSSSPSQIVAASWTPFSPYSIFKLTAVGSFCFWAVFGTDLWRISGQYSCPGFPPSFPRVAQAGRLPGGTKPRCQIHVLIKNHDAKYTPGPRKTTTRNTRVRRSKWGHCDWPLGRLWYRRCWVSDARLLLISSTASSRCSAPNRRNGMMTARRISIGDLAR